MVMTSENRTGHEFKRGVAAGMNFPGVVVRSEIRNYQGKDSWNIWIYNRSTNNFVRQSANLVDEDSEAYPKSTIRKIRAAFDKAGVPANNTDDIVAVEFEFATKVEDMNINGTDITVVRYLAQRRLGLALDDEMQQLNVQLDLKLTPKGNRDGGGTSVTSTPIDLDASDIDALTKLFEGKTEDEAKAAASRSRTLSTNAVNAVVTGAAATYLIGQGHLTVDEDSGKYEAV